MAPEATDLKDEICRAQQLGQKLEDLVVNAGKITIKDEGSPLLIGFWSLVCDYDKGLLNLIALEVLRCGIRPVASFCGGDRPRALVADASSRWPGQDEEG